MEMREEMIVEGLSQIISLSLGFDQTRYGKEMKYRAEFVDKRNICYSVIILFHLLSSAPSLLVIRLVNRSFFVVSERND